MRDSDRKGFGDVPGASAPRRAPRRLFGLPQAVLTGGLLLTMSCGTPETVKDIDNNAYPVVLIGGQAWLGSNLRVTRGTDGTTLVTHAPNDDAGTSERFGLLYEWEAARRACMKGWHLPTDGEWGALVAAAGVWAGGALKDTIGWASPRRITSARVPFGARGAGHWTNGEFPSRFLESVVYWSATPADSHFVWTRTMSATHDSVGRTQQHPDHGFSIRCVRDD